MASSLAALVCVLALGARPDDALVAQATAKLKEKDDAGALPLLRQAVKSDPKDPRPHFLQGTALSRLGKKEDAAKAYRAALALDAHQPEVHNELGAVLEELGRTEEAIPEFEAAAAMKPSLCEAWSNAGRAHLVRHDPQGAAEAFGKGAAACPFDADLPVDQSMALREAKRYPESAAAARRALDARPEDADAHLNLALTLQLQKKLDESAAEFRAATERKPELATAWWGLGTLELSRGRADAAVAALEKAAKLDPKGAVYADLLAALRKKGDWKRADAVLGEALEKSPRSLALALEKVRLLVAEKRCADAKQAAAGLPAGKEAVKALRQELGAACP